MPAQVRNADTPPGVHARAEAPVPATRSATGNTSARDSGLAAEPPAAPGFLDLRTVDAAILIDTHLHLLNWLRSAGAGELQTWLQANMTRGEERDPWIMGVAISRLVSLDPDLALGLLVQPGSDDPHLVSMVYSALARTDLEHALAALSGLPDNLRNPAAGGILEGASVADTQAWIALLETFASDTRSSNLTLTWAMRSVKKDPEGVFQALIENPPADDAGNPPLLAFMTVWLMDGDNRARQALESMPEPQRRIWLQRNLQSGLPARDPAEAVDWLLSRTHDSLDPLLPGTLRNLASTEPARAIEIAQSLDDTLARQSLAYAVDVWSLTSPVAAAEWVVANTSQVDAPARIRAIARQFAWRDYPAAQGWAETITAPELQHIAREAVASTRLPE